MNIIKMYMNNVIILILAVRICEDSDTRGSDKRGYTVCGSCSHLIVSNKLEWSTDMLCSAHKHKDKFCRVAFSSDIYYPHTIYSFKLH